MKSANNNVSFLFKWFCTILFVSAVVGSVSALFLVLLNAVTSFRESHIWVIALLPFAGIFIVWLYQKYGGTANKGNNLILEEYYHPKKRMPLRMSPFIILTTLITHLFGGSAGREGTAVQYGASIADQFSRFFNFTKAERRILLMCGMAAGFASLFGTPWAGAIFGMEVVRLGKRRWKGIIPILLTAHLSSVVCSLYGDLHTHYPHVEVPPAFSWATWGWIVVVGVICGLVAILFHLCGKWFSTAFRKIKWTLLRPFIGGVIIALGVYLSGSTKYIGLGIPTILEAFEQQLPTYDFLIKVLLTTLTLSAGFKGGEVTPLFFIGATLGNALFLFIPLPLVLLAALGFIAVFSGCTKTPVACCIMGMEMFGPQAVLWFATACLVSYWVSGRFGIYNSQRNRSLRFL